MLMLIHQLHPLDKQTTICDIQCFTELIYDNDEAQTVL